MLYKKPLFAYYVIPMIMRPTYQMNDGVLIRYGVCESSVVKVDSKHTHTHNWPIRTFHHCHWHKECEGESMHALRTYISLDSIVVVPFPMLDWFPVVATCYEHTYSHTHTHSRTHLLCSRCVRHCYVYYSMATMPIYVAMDPIWTYWLTHKMAYSFVAYNYSLSTIYYTRK